MFRNILSIIVALAIVFSLVGCSNSQKENSVLSTNSTPEPTMDKTQSHTSEVTTFETTNETVYRELILPDYWVASESPDDFDPDEYAKEQNFTSVSIREDGYLVAIVTEQRYEEYKNKLTVDADDSFASMINSEETPYIKDIERNEDFSHFKVTIDQQILDDSLDWNLFGLILSVSTYQTIFQIEYSLQIDLIDYATGDVYRTHTYPEAES